MAIGPRVAESMRRLDARGWVLLEDVDPVEQHELREALRSVEWDRGWTLRTSYHQETRSLSIVGSTRRLPGHGPGRASRDPSA